ncbi:MAG: lipoprotein [Acidobacteriota bacterium]
MRKTHAVAALMLLITSLAACGRKGPPLPPIIEVPETSVIMGPRQEEQEVVLSWKFPALTRSGRMLTDLARVEVWRLEVPPGQDLAISGPTAEELRRQLMLSRGVLVERMEGEGLRLATRGGQLEHREPVTPGAEGSTPPLFWYAVRSLRRDGTASALSNIVTWQAQPVPPGVEGFAARVQKDGIALTWEPVPGARYLIERREAGGRWEEGRSKLEEKEGLLDPTARQGKTWRYRVRAVVKPTAGLTGNIGGPPTEELEVAYPDIYAPPAPASFICLPEPDMVRLRWDPSPEANVTYKVFRRQGGDKWQHVEEKTTNTEYADMSPLDGEAEYAVKAVDEAGNQSEALYCTVRITD